MTHVEKIENLITNSIGDNESILPRRVLTDSMAEAEAAVYGAYGNSVTINTISIKNIK